MQGAVMNADIPGVVRLLDGYFGGTPYSLTSLFTDEQRRILKLILKTTIQEVETTLSSIYEGHASLLHYLSQAGLPKPPALTLAAGFSVNIGLGMCSKRKPSIPAGYTACSRWRKQTRCSLTPMCSGMWRASG